MNLDWYRVFFQLARSKSFSSASKQLYVTQPAVSRTIAQLEDALGCELFYRTRQGVTLTEQGRILYKNLEEAFNAISIAEKAIADIQTLQKGEVKFGASDTLFKYYLINVLKTFNQDFPEIKIRIISQNTAKIIEAVKCGDIDFGIVYLFNNQDKSLNYKPIITEQDCFVVGEEYKHLTNRKKHLKDISDYPFIMLNNSTNTRKHINKFLKDKSINIIPAYESGNTDLLVEFAKNNFGIACVCKNFIKEELKNGELYELDLYEKIPSRDLCVAWLKNIPLSIVSNAFIEKIENIKF